MSAAPVALENPEDWIELVPLASCSRAEISVPGSKSITNRALVLAALGHATVRLDGALWSEDTQAMVDCLKRLGFQVVVKEDSSESSNRSITVHGRGGCVPDAGTNSRPLELLVGNAGTAARFLAALVCLGSGVYRLSGVPRMHERPQAALFTALRQLGYHIDSPNDRLPAVIHGTGPRQASCAVSIADSSQFASALLLAAGAGRWTIQTVGENAEESPYITMTRELIRVFPTADARFQIEPDASSGSYFWAAGWLLRGPEAQPPPSSRGWRQDSPVTVPGWPESGWQIDAQFPRFLPLPREVSRSRDLADSIMTAIVLAPWASHAVQFTELGRLRVQECERVRALRTELHKCGARVSEAGDTLEVAPGSLRGALINTYQDHRMAMCFSILGLKVSGMRIQNPGCVNKTFPGFFQKLATPPPYGLGASILNSGGSLLSAEQLSFGADLGLGASGPSAGL